MAQGESLTVSSVERALEILNAFEGAPPSLTLAELSERTGLYKSTILRLIETMSKYDYVLKLSDGSYQIGPRLFLLGARFQTSVMPAEWVLPTLKHLSVETGESASFNIRNGDFRVCLWRVDSPHLLRDHTQPGDIRPLGTGAAGKLLMAFSEPLAPEYAELRKHPLSKSIGEIENDMAGLGAPIFDVNGQIRGVLTLSGPCTRFTEEKTKSMAETLWRSAIDLTKRIGGDTKGFAEGIGQAEFTAK